MQTGIVGLQFSGKSTLFSTLLTGKGGDENKHFGEAERGIVKVPDPRLDKLTAMFNPKKQVNATIEYVKVPGIEQEGHRGSGLPAQFLSNVKSVDLIVMVVRAFENDMYPHPSGSVDPARDMAYVTSEFLLADLAIVETRVEKLEKLVMKTKQDQDIRELAVLKKCLEQLENEKPLRELELDEHEALAIRGFQFLSAKPLLFVLNVAEDDISKIDELIAKYSDFAGPRCAVTALSAEIEKEIASLDEEDAKTFLEDLQIAEPATSKMIRETYQLLGLQSFFTVGEDECRSWTIKTGTNAQKAAGVIHSDLEKGFIRAEVVSYDDLIANGSLAACKDKGVLRLEGKQYIVADGDILNIRFNI